MTATARNGVLSAREGEALAGLFQLITATYRSPGDALAADLESGRLASLAGTVAASLDVPAPRLPVIDWSALEARYVELFVTARGRLPAPPYAGYALDGELLGDSVTALKRFYDAHGFELDPEWRDLPDHVALIAEAGTLLCAAGRVEPAMELMTRYLLPWFERYASAVIERDADGLYGSMTRFLSTATNEVKREAAA
jgi:putative dimethyl sulfoxide reductase chaperone